MGGQNGGCFGRCGNLIEVNLPTVITGIPQYCFFECGKLETINIHSGITSVGECAFKNTHITCELNLPNLTSLGRMAFEGTRIPRIVSLGNLVEIPSDSSGAYGGCFSYNDSLTEVTLPNTLLKIGSRAFYECSNLTTFNFSSSITGIGEYAFNDVPITTELNLPNLVSLGAKCFLGTRVTKIISLGILTEIPTDSSGAYGGCFSYNTALTEVTLPSTLTSIGNRAFSYDRNLVLVKCLATTPPSLNSSAFNDTNANLKIYVPNGCGDTYKTASV